MGRPLRLAPELFRTHLPSSHHAAPDCQGPGAGRQRGPEQRSEAHHPRAGGHGSPPQCSAQRHFWDDNHLPGGPSPALAAQPHLGLDSRVPGPRTGLPLAVGCQACSLTDCTARCLRPSHVESISVSRHPCVCFSHLAWEVVVGYPSLERWGSGVWLEWRGSVLSTDGVGDCRQRERSRCWERLAVLGLQWSGVWGEARERRFPCWL